MRRGPVILAEGLLDSSGVLGVRLAILRPLAQLRLGLGNNALVGGSRPMLESPLAISFDVVPCLRWGNAVRAAVRLTEWGKEEIGVVDARQPRVVRFRLLVRCFGHLDRLDLFGGRMGVNRPSTFQLGPIFRALGLFLGRGVIN